MTNAGDKRKMNSSSNIHRGSRKGTCKDQTDGWKAEARVFPKCYTRSQNEGRDVRIAGVLLHRLDRRRGQLHAGTVQSLSCLEQCSCEPSGKGWPSVQTLWVILRPLA